MSELSGVIEELMLLTAARGMEPGEQIRPEGRDRHGGRLPSVQLEIRGKRREGFAAFFKRGGASMQFGDMFSMPREPRTALAPGQSRKLPVAKGERVVVTDVYIENLGGGSSVVTISEQQHGTSFEVRYSFGVAAGEVRVINYSTGLRLGEEDPIEDCIKVDNAQGSAASVLVRLNGYFVS